MVARVFDSTELMSQGCHKCLPESRSARIFDWQLTRLTPLASQLRFESHAKGLADLLFPACLYLVVGYCLQYSELMSKTTSVQVSTAALSEMSCANR